MSIKQVENFSHSTYDISNDKCNEDSPFLQDFTLHSLDSSSLADEDDYSFSDSTNSPTLDSDDSVLGRLSIQENFSFDTKAEIDAINIDAACSQSKIQSQAVDASFEPSPKSVTKRKCVS